MNALPNLLHLSCNFEPHSTFHIFILPLTIFNFQHFTFYHFYFICSIDRCCLSYLHLGKKRCCLSYNMYNVQNDNIISPFATTKKRCCLSYIDLFIQRNTCNVELYEIITKETTQRVKSEKLMHAYTSLTWNIQMKELL